jgi:hypothetical protein
MITMLQTNNQSKLPVGLPVQLSQIIIGAAAAAIVFGFFWTILTLPGNLLLISGITSSDGAQTNAFLNIFIGLMPILMGLLCVAWAYTKAVEEREYGQTLPD